jgi:hypothetical protein
MQAKRRIYSNFERFKPDRGTSRVRIRPGRHRRARIKGHDRVASLLGELRNSDIVIINIDHKRRLPALLAIASIFLLETF